MTRIQCLIIVVYLVLVVGLASRWRQSDEVTPHPGLHDELAQSGY